MSGFDASVGVLVNRYGEVLGTSRRNDLDVFGLPGGKPEGSESGYECLARSDWSAQRQLDEAFRHEHPPGPSGYCACAQCLGMVE